MVIPKYLTVTLFVAFISGCASSWNDIDQYSTAIERQQSIHSIKKLQARYFHLVDLLENNSSAKPKYEELVNSLFINDGVWILESQDGEDVRFEGEDGLLRFAQWLDSLYSEGVYIKHLSLNPEIEVKGNRALSREPLIMIWANKESQENAISFGVYEDILQKNSAGLWRFKSKRLRFTGAVNINSQ